MRQTVAVHDEDEVSVGRGWRLEAEALLSKHHVMKHLRLTSIYEQFFYHSTFSQTMSYTDLQEPFPPLCALNKDRLRSYANTPTPAPSLRISLHCDQQADHIAVDHLPGYPAVPLVPDEIYAHLGRELDTPF